MSSSIFSITLSLPLPCCVIYAHLFCPTIPPLPSSRVMPERVVIQYHGNCFKVTLKAKELYLGRVRGKTYQNLTWSLRCVAGISGIIHGSFTFLLLQIKKRKKQFLLLCAYINWYICMNATEEIIILSVNNFQPKWTVYLNTASSDLLKFVCTCSKACNWNKSREKKTSDYKQKKKMSSCAPTEIFQVSTASTLHCFILNVKM